MDKRILKRIFKIKNAQKFCMECLWCKTEFVIDAGPYNFGVGTFCRNACSFAYQYASGKHPSWKGGRIIRSGYIYLHKPNHPNSGKQGYIAEHRLKMEEEIGRYLTKKEVVRHINEDKQDNRIENLELYESAGKHTAKAHPELLKRMSEICRTRPSWNAGRTDLPPAWNKGIAMSPFSKAKMIARKKLLKFLT